MGAYKDIALREEENRMSDYPLNQHDKETARLIADLENQIEVLREALEQATDQLEREYSPTPLDGDVALIRKLRATIASAKVPAPVGEVNE